MSRLIAEPKLPDTPVNACLALWGLWVRLQLQALDGPKRGADRIELPAAGPLLTVDELQLQGEVTELIETVLKLVAKLVCCFDGLFDGRCWSFGGCLIGWLRWWHGFPFCWCCCRRCRSWWSCIHRSGFVVHGWLALCSIGSHWHHNHLFALVVEPQRTELINEADGVEAVLQGLDEQVTVQENGHIGS